jgi:hypothetical protein
MTKRNFIFRVCGVMASPLGWYGGKARAQETTGVGNAARNILSLGMSDAGASLQNLALLPSGGLK